VNPIEIQVRRLDPDVPLLPPGAQEGPAAQMLRALEREPDGRRAAEQVRQQLAQEAGPRSE